jgi:arylsulfatase A-like enzyme
LRPFPLMLIAVAIPLAGACMRTKRDRPTSPPPVVLVSLDTVRADRLNCYGYSARRVTPNLDALARDGVLFENHISAAPWTPPAHASLLTSLWPSTHGVTDSFRAYKAIRRGGTFHRLASSWTTLAEVLRSAGYETGAFTGGMTLDARLGFNQGFETFRETMFKLNPQNVDEMLSWIAARRGRPFFLFWHTFEAHAPYLGTRFLADVLPPEEAAGLAAAAQRYAQKLDEGEWGPSLFPRILKRRQVYRRDVTEALYVGSIAEADRWVGVLLAALKREGLYHRMLVVVTSDHGEEFADRSPDVFYDAHGHNLHREMVRVPLIVKLPSERAAGTRVGAVTRAVDVMPTVLDVLSLPGPVQMQGLSLRAVWEGRERAPRSAFVEALGGLNEQKSIRTRQLAFVLGIGPESVERRGRAYVPDVPRFRSLFDLRRDPDEQRNLLAGTPTEADRRTAEELERALRAHLAGQGGARETIEFDAERLERLRALGYVR